MPGSLKFYFLLASSVLITQTTISPVFAQEIEPDAPQEARSEGVADIIVTARKQNESVLATPVAVTALGAEDIAARGIKGYSDLNNFAPNFRFQEQGSASNTRSYFTVTTRGIFPGSAAPERQTTSMFLDGVPIGGGGTIGGLTDIEQIEVVNGPQSAYFGRSTFAGAVNFITRAPRDEMRVAASVELATYDSYELTASVEGGIVPDLLAARVSARAFGRGGQYENYGFGGKLGSQRTQSGSVSLSFTPSSAIRVRGYLSAWSDDDGPGATGQLIRKDYNCNAGATTGAFNYICGPIKSVPASSISQNTDLPPEVIQSLRENNVVTGYDFINDFGLHREGLQATAMADIDLPWGFTLSANYGHSKNKWSTISDNGNRPDPTVHATYLIPYNISSDSAEIRLASPSDARFRALVGANWFKQRTYANNLQNKNGSFASASAYRLDLTDTIGFFGSLAYDLSDSLTINLEGRLQRDHVRQDILSTPGVYEADGKTWSFTPRAILQYHVSPDIELYASYAEGTRPVQFNTSVFALPDAALEQILDQAPVQLKVDEERLKMYEVGFKGNLFDRRLRIMAAAYYGDWSDRQIQVLLPYDLGAGVSTATVVMPDGEVELYGLELQTTFKATPRLTFDGTLGYAETKIKNTSCVTCARITGETNPVGNRLERYPAITGSASLDYRVPVSGSFDGFGRLDYFYTGKIFATEANVAYIPGGSKLNFRIGVENDKYSFSLFVRNLLNDKTPIGINRVADTYDSSNNIALAPPEKRLIGATVRVSY